MTKRLLPLLLASVALTANAGLFDAFSSKDKKPEQAPAADAKAPAADTKAPAAPAAPAAPTAPAAPAMTDAIKAQVAEASKAAMEEVKVLMKDPATTGPIKEQLAKLSDSLAGGKDGATAEALAKIVALKPSEQQMGVVKELQGNVSALVLGRSLNTAEGTTAGAIKGALDAIKAKDTAAIIGNLQKVAADTKLTDAQKQMAGNLIASWNPKLAAAADKAKAGMDKLKGFGL